MKTRLLLAIVIVALSGCSKSDSPAPSIVGTWKLVSTALTACPDPTFNSTTPCTSGCSTITFSASGTFTSGSASGTYTLTGNKITITQSTSFTSTIAITSTTLTLTGEALGCISTVIYTRV